MSKIYIFLADGFEEIEALTVVDLLRRGGEEAIMVSITGSRQVTGSHQITVQADITVEEADPDQADMLVLPGGMPGTLNLKANSWLAEQLKRYHDKKKYISAVCAAPTVLAGLGILEGRTASCHFSVEDQMSQAGVIISRQPVTVSDHIITSRGLGTSIDFSLAIIEQLHGREMADKIAAAIVYDRREVV